MTKKDHLRTLKLLSALESWSYVNMDHRELPAYLKEEISYVVVMHEHEILGTEPMPK